MERIRAPRLSYSSVTSTLALFVALGGTSWAVATLPEGSVGTRELANGAVTGAKVKNGSLTHRDVENASLTGGELLDGTLSTREVGEGSLNGGDVRDGSLDGRDVARGALTGEHVRDGSIGLEKLAGLPDLPDALKPTGAAGGDLAGTYPDPQLGTGVVGLPEVADLLKDGPAAATTLRSLGTGATQAAAGDDARFPASGEKAALAGTSGTPGAGNRYVTDADARLTDARTPTGAAGGDLTGTYPSPAVASNAIDSAAVADGSLRLRDVRVFTSALSVGAATLGAHACTDAVVDLTAFFDVQAGDVVEAQPPTTGTDNAPGVVWIGGTEDGDETVNFRVCNLNGASASAGGVIPFAVYRP